MAIMAKPKSIATSKQKLPHLKTHLEGGEEAYAVAAR